MIICHYVRKHNLCGVIILAWKYTTFNFVTSNEGINGKFKAHFRSKIDSNPKVNCSSSNNQAVVESTVSELHEKWASQFKDEGVPEPELSIKYIIQHVLNTREEYHHEPILKKKLTKEEEKEITTLCECRLARMPVQYIIKEWDFRELCLAMSPPVFIPRPETEELLDLVLDRAPAEAVFLEVGCGSGAICLSLLKEHPNARVIAVDQSSAACQLTLKNAEINGLTKNLQVVQSKLQDDGTFTVPLKKDLVVDVLVSNPPYVPYAQLLDLQPEIKLYEDLRALEAGRDGLRVVRALMLLAQSVLKPGGHIFLEVDCTHPLLIQKWVTEHPELNIKFVKSYKDFAEKDRFVELKKI